MLIVRRGAITRAAHLLPFALPGGDAAIRHPWRTALAVLHAAGLEAGGDLPCVAAVPARDRAIVDRQLTGSFGCVKTTSMGRLFDAVASLTGLRHSIDYEAEAAIDLERAAAAGGAVGPYRGCVAEEPGGSITLDWRPIVRGVVADVVAGLPAAAIAGGFHRAIAALVVDACLLLRRRGAGMK